MNVVNTDINIDWEFKDDPFADFVNDEKRNTNNNNNKKKNIEENKNNVFDIFNDNNYDSNNQKLI